MSEPVYTLSDARRIMALNECVDYGHSWEVIESMSGPVRLVCDRCGWSGSVTMGERPKRPGADA